MKSYSRGRLVEIRCDKCKEVTIEPNTFIHKSGWRAAGITKGSGPKMGMCIGGWSNDYCPDCWDKYSAEIMRELDDLADPEGLRNRHPWDLLCEAIRVINARRKSK